MLIRTFVPYLLMLCAFVISFCTCLFFHYKKKGHSFLENKEEIIVLYTIISGICSFVVYLIFSNIGCFTGPKVGIVTYDCKYEEYYVFSKYMHNGQTISNEYPYYVINRSGLSLQYYYVAYGRNVSPKPTTYIFPNEMKGLPFVPNYCLKKEPYFITVKKNVTGKLMVVLDFCL